MEQPPRHNLPEDDSAREELQARRLEQLYDAIRQSHSSELTSTDDEDFREALTILKALDEVGPLGKVPAVTLDDESARERETQFDLEAVDIPLGMDAGDHLPSQLGRFRIQRLLGRGGHGMVLLARDEKLRRDVALKLPRPDVVLDPFLKQRFVQEAQFAAAVSHPNLVPVYEAGVIGPFCYIAYAFCQGTSLGRWLKQRTEPVDPSLAAEIVAVLADAIQSAHSQGIVHRDLKPNNVLLDGVAESAKSFDPASACKITDFGLAKSGSEDSDLTRSGAIVGTLAYLAPEQATAGLTPVGPSADLFCLGLMLYQMLTLKNPFQHASPLDTLSAIRDCNPPAPRQLNPKISRDLESVCLKCLERHPTARYASATDLANDLRRFLRGEPVQARPIRKVDRLVRWCYRHPAHSVMVAISVTILVVAAIGMTLQWQRAETNLTIAKSEFQRAERSLQQADSERALAESNLQLAQDSIDDFLNIFSDELADVRQIDHKRRMLLTRALRLQEQLLASYQDRPQVRLQKSQAHFRIARIQGRLGEFQAAIDQCDLALAECQQAIEQRPDAKQVDSTQFQDIEFDRNLMQRDIFRERATLLQSHGRIPEAIEDIKKAIHFGEQYVAQHPNHGAMQRGNAEDLRSLGILVTGLGKRDLAGEYFRAAVQQLDRIEGEECVSIRFQIAKASCLNSLAVHERSNRNSAAALELYNAAIEVLEPLVEQDPMFLEASSMLASTRYNCGNLFLNIDDPQGVAENYYAAAKVDFERLAREHPLVFSYRSMLGKTLFALGYRCKVAGELPEAEKHYLRALEVQRSLIDDFPSNAAPRNDYAKSCSNLSTVYMTLDRLDEARSVLELGTSTSEELVAEYPGVLSYRIGLAVSLANLGSLEMKLENFDKSAQWLRQAIMHLEGIVTQLPNIKSYRQYLVEDYQMLARAYARQALFPEAIATAERIMLLEPVTSESQLATASAFAEILTEIEPARGESPTNPDLSPEELKDQALSLLSSAVSANPDFRQQLQAPVFDQLRTDERFPAETPSGEEVVPFNQ